MSKHIYTALLVIIFAQFAKAQNPTTYVFPSPDTPPPNLSVDSYTRATTRINLKSVLVNSTQTNFRYGFVSGGAAKLLNLSISSNPNFVNSAYLGSAANPQLNGCTNGLPPDVNKPVGETAGNFAVSPVGAAVYNIPIVVSPGTMGVEPKLSVMYNSQAGLGLLGWGGMLSGLSAISRTGKTPMLDGKFDGIALNINDVYSLDGNRLLISGTSTAAYGLNGASYYTENESFASIISNGAQGNGPQSLQVKDKNGNILDYGSTADSRLAGVGDNTVLSWYLNKMTDEFGNYMLYSYAQLGGELVLDKIDYTGNIAAGLNSYNSVKFEYIALAEKTSFYIAGKEFKKTQLLKSITCLSGNDLVRKYIFDYDWVNNGTYLASVKEVDSNGNELNPTNFCWSDPNDFGGTKDFQNSQIFANASDYTNMNAIPADLNGDGFSDYVCVYPSNGRIRVMQNDFKTTYGTSNSTIQFSQKSDYTNMSPNANVLLSANVTDHNNDNKQEVYTIFDATTPFNLPNSSTYNVLKTELDPMANTSITTIGTYNISFYNTTFKPSQFYYDTGDHDGDAINDVLRIDPFSINLTTALGGVSYAISTTSTIVRPFLFNNDALTDYLVLEHQAVNTVNLKIVSLSVNGSNQQSLSQIYSQSFSFTNSNNRNLLLNFGFGDFNGDGIGDVVYINDTFSAMYILKGTGNGFLAAQQVNSFTALQNSSAFKYTLNVVDINGDGKSDITITDNVAQLSTNPVNNYFTYFSLGDIIIKGGSYSGNWTHGTENVYIREFNYEGVTYTGGWDVPVDFINGYEVKADFNGDGVYDMTSFNSPSQDATIANNVNGRSKYSVIAIITPLKKRLDIRYANINSEIYVQSGGVKQEIYKKQSITTYTSPLFNYKLNLYCVDNTSESSGFNAQIIRRKKYVYSDAIMHKGGRGFVGFEQMMVFDRFNQMGIITKSTFNTTYNIALNTEIVDGKIITSTNTLNISTYSLDNTKLISKTQNSISLVPRYSQGFFISLDQNTAKDYLNSTQAVTNFTYNLSNFGSLSNKITQHGWSGNPIIKTLQSSYTYTLVNNYYKSLKETNSQTQTGNTAYTRTKDYTYDAQGRLITTINDQGNTNLNNKQLSTVYSQFNLFGAPTIITVSAGDLPARTSQVVHDVTGRFPIKQINAIGNFEEYVYEPKYGKVIEAKDISGLSTKYIYDGLGRLIKTIFPNNAVNQTTYAWDDPGTSYPYSTNRFGVYSVKTEVEANGYTKVYCSSNGEVLREESLDYAGQIVVKDVKYNSSTNFSYPDGVILESTEPHYIGQLKYLITRYNYETTYYRPSGQNTYSVNNGSAVNTGIFNQISYNVPSTELTYTPSVVSTINQNNQQVIKNTNAAGQLTKLSNYSSVVQQNTLYDYHSNGKPNSVTLNRNGGAPFNIVHSFVYNDLGQRTQLIDPSLGTVSYTYNTLGEVLTETKPNGSFTYAYDNLGRLTTRTGSVSGVYTYQYVAIGNGKQQISKITGPNSVTDFIYDVFNRPSQNKETVSSTNKILTSSYAYDIYGREVQQTYPSGFITKKVYNAQGHLSAITNSANANLWQLVSKDALGRIREYNYGNGINTKNTYDDLNYLSIINHGNGSIHKQTYTYNGLTGNLNSKVFENYIVPLAQILKESFTFDGLDRLYQTDQINPSNSAIIQTNGLSYDERGNITHKDDAGDLVYNIAAKPFTLTYIDNATGNISPYTLNVTYNDFDKVKQLSEMTTNKQLDVVYGNDNERIKVDYSISGVNQYTRYYAENYDRQETGGTYKEWTYIFAPSGLCAVNYNNNGSTQLNYVLTDHLGSPVLLTSTNGTLVEQFSFDTWGRRRNPTDWSYNAIPTPSTMIRGYTLHEHLDEFALINMNGRVYDPVIGRFIQPDNYVQAPDVLQNYNRYAYCLNNPLKYTDPSGYLFSDLKGGFENFFGDLFGATHANQQMGSQYAADASKQAALMTFAYAQATAKVQVAILGAALGGGFATFALQSTLSGFIGCAMYGAFTGAFTGAITGALNAAIDGGDVKQGAITGAKWGGITGGLVGGLAGGFGAAADGRDFFTGELSNANKLKYCLDIYSCELAQEFGQDGPTEVILGTEENLAGTGFRTSYGDMVSPQGEVVNGFTQPSTKAFGVNAEGYAKFNSKVYVSKNAVKQMWNNAPEGKETMFHEWFHANQLKTGAYSRDLFILGNEDRTTFWQEIKAHSYNYGRYSTQSRADQIMHYLILFAK